MCCVSLLSFVCYYLCIYFYLYSGAVPFLLPCLSRTDRTDHGREPAHLGVSVHQEVQAEPPQLAPRRAAALALLARAQEGGRVPGVWGGGLKFGTS